MKNTFVKFIRKAIQARGFGGQSSLNGGLQLKELERGH